MSGQRDEKGIPNSKNSEQRFRILALFDLQVEIQP